MRARVLTGNPTALLTLLCAAASGRPVQAEWPQWGGPNRNFVVEATGLADKWPEEGPTKLWHRELGDGYSAIVVDDGVLYTMYRRSPTDNEEYTVALDAKTGRTTWEHKNPAPLTEPPNENWGGQGPNSTPLIVGNRLYTIGSRVVMNCFDMKTGEVLWKHDLAVEFAAPISSTCGYSPSPIAYKNMIVVPTGCTRPERSSGAATRDPKGWTLVALDQVSGRVVWKNLEFQIGFSSPVLIKLNDQDQLVFHLRGGIIGVNPDNGALLWRHALERNPVVTPVWNGDDLVFWSAGGDSAVGRVLRLVERDGKATAEELWSSRKAGIPMATPVRIGDCLIGATDRLLLGVNMKTGKREWAKRGFPTASCVYADGKLVILDENGRLTLATLTPGGLTVHSQCKVTERYSFTAPTLVGTTLYVRDRKNIMALDLG